MLLSIPVPKNGELTLKVGQMVDFTTSFIRFSQKNEIKVPLAHDLHIQPKRIFSYVKKLVGETIKEGEILAVKKTLLTNQYYKSQHNGIITEISHEEGYVLIEQAPSGSQTKNAYFKGEVFHVTPSEIKLTVQQLKTFPLKNNPVREKEHKDQWGGEVWYLDNERPDKSVGEMIFEKILLAETLSPYHQSKYEVLGIRGFVSIQELPQKTSLQNAVLKNKTDGEIIKTARFPYCIVDDNNNTITFYITK